LYANSNGTSHVPNAAADTGELAVAVL
jgi:hypothetical protein